MKFESKYAIGDIVKLSDQYVMSHDPECGQYCTVGQIVVKDEAGEHKYAYMMEGMKYPINEDCIECKMQEVSS